MAVTEIQVLYLGVIGSFYRLFEVGVQRIVAVHFNAVCYVYLYALIYIRRPFDKFFTESIDAFCVCITETEHTIDLFTGDIRGSIVEHAEYIGGAQRRNKETVLYIFRSRNCAEKIKGKPVVAVDIGLLLGIQVYLYQIVKAFFGVSVAFCVFRSAARCQTNRPYKGDRTCV